MTSIGKSGYDRLAFAYDFLASLIYGKAIRDIQINFLQAISEEAKVLILGGGTGWQLSKLLTLKPRIHVSYLDISGEMIKKAKLLLNNRKTKNVQFIRGNSLDKLLGEFDFVITPFYFDLFSDEELKKHCLPEIKRKLKQQGGHLLCYDFQLICGGLLGAYQRFLIGVTILFFKLATGLRTSKLANIEKRLLEAGFYLEEKIESKQKLIWAGKFSC